MQNHRFLRSKISSANLSNRINETPFELNEGADSDNPDGLRKDSVINSV